MLCRVLHEGNSSDTSEMLLTDRMLAELSRGPSRAFSAAGMDSARLQALRATEDKLAKVS
jgi:hypothetical protein